MPAATLAASPASAVPAAPATALATTAGASTALRTLWALAGLSAALLVVFAAAGWLDERTLDGADLWVKPAKFALSFVVLHASLAWVVERLSPPVRDGAALRWTVHALVLATAVEMGYITAQAARGVHSHFNLSTPFEAAMYTVMGAGALTLVAGISVVGWLAGRDAAARLGPGLREGVRTGFLLSAALTVVTATYLSSQGSHLVGSAPPGAAVIPVFGWSATVGDLRPAHFLALHAMQALPLLGWWRDRRGGDPTMPVRRAAVAWAIATAAVFGQALMGLPLVRL
jgi:hypothetical protein